MKKLAAIASTLAQSVFFLSMIVMFGQLLNVPDEVISASDQNLEPIKAYIVDVMVRYRPLIGVGVIGGILSWVALRRWNFRPPWFLTVTRIFGWAWMPFIPVGTGLGILILSGRPNGSAEDEASAT